VATQLHERGAPAIDIDGQIAVAGRLNSEAERITGVRFGFNLVQPDN
jgi:hypothetical protein